MSTTAKFLALAVGIGAIASGCAVNSSTPEPGKTGETAEKLEMVRTEKKISGTYVSELGEKVMFEAVAQDKDVYEVDLKLRGLTLDATIAYSDHTTTMDGFSSDNGRDTQILGDDQKLILQFSKAINATLASTKEHQDRIADMLGASTSVWGETPPSVKLNRRVMGDEGRGWTSICGSIGGTYGASHDCWNGGWWSGQNSQNAYVGYNTGSTYYWRGYWSTSSYDHAGWPYEYGNCFGQCGAGCGNAQRYTVDCHNHDGCVRNGHWVGSPYCDDEFSSASDDYYYATNCYRD